MRSLKIVFFLTFMIAATSCVIGPQGNYYRPSYPDDSASFEGSWAHGGAGPPAVIKFAAEGRVIVKARLNPEKDGKMRLQLIIDVPRGSSAQFAFNEIKLTDPNSGQEWVKEAQQLNLLQGASITVPVSATINFDEIGTTTSLHVPTDISWRNFHVCVPFSILNYQPRAVRIYLPPIIAHDKEYQIPAIELVENEEIKEKNRIETINNQRLWWWPYKAQERKDGSWVKVDDFIFGGGVTSGYYRDEFGGNIMVSFPPSVKWRFSSNEIRIVDIDTGEERHVSFGSVYPKFYLTTSFTSPVLGNGSLVNTTAVADIIVSEKPLELLIVQLPNVLINGKEIRRKPITFRKSFGIGVIPLNY